MNNPLGFLLRHRIAVTILSILLFASARSAQAQKKSSFPTYKHPVTIWVPPYAVDKSRVQIDTSYENIGAKDSITHLALQFWVPTLQGGVAKVGYLQDRDKTIADLREWGHSRGIRVMLCIFNGENNWDWPLARAGFMEHPDDFAKALIAEMDRYKLDGIDMDLEGNDTYAEDKAPFVAFMTTLSKALRARNKHLTVDTFSAMQWNAPNQSWWPELFPLVDALTTMGYDDSGITAPDWRSYAAQKKTAGAYAAKLQIGIPSDKDMWRGNTAQEQIDWLRKDGSMGIGIWDAQLPSSAWKNASIWQAVGEIRGSKPLNKKK